MLLEESCTKATMVTRVLQKKSTKITVGKPGQRKAHTRGYDDMCFNYNFNINPQACKARTCTLINIFVPYTLCFSTRNKKKR